MVGGLATGGPRGPPPRSPPSAHLALTSPQVLVRNPAYHTSQAGHSGATGGGEDAWWFVPPMAATGVRLEPESMSGDHHIQHHPRQARGASRPGRRRLRFFRRVVVTSSEDAEEEQEVRRVRSSDDGAVFVPGDRVVGGTRAWDGSQWATYRAAILSPRSPRAGRQPYFTAAAGSGRSGPRGVAGVAGPSTATGRALDDDPGHPAQPPDSQWEGTHGGGGDGSLGGDAWGLVPAPQAVLGTTVPMEPSVSGTDLGGLEQGLTHSTVTLGTHAAAGLGARAPGPSTPPALRSSQWQLTRTFTSQASDSELAGTGSVYASVSHGVFNASAIQVVLSGPPGKSARPG